MSASDADYANTVNAKQTVPDEQMQEKSWFVFL